MRSTLSAFPGHFDVIYQNQVVSLGVPLQGCKPSHHFGETKHYTQGRLSFVYNIVVERVFLTFDWTLWHRFCWTWHIPLAHSGLSQSFEVGDFIVGVGS